MKLIPATFLIVTLTTAFVIVFILKNQKQETGGQSGRHKKQKLTKQQAAASELTNVLDIRDRFLYSRDGLIFTYLKITPVSLDLLSEREKEVLSSVLFAELSRETKPFKFIALSRPVDITPLIDEYESLLSATGNEKQKELLRLEMNQMKEYAGSEGVVERQFFIALWDKYTPGCETEMLKRTKDFVISFEAASVGYEILDEDGIIRLINMIHNPAFVHLEDTDYREHIPMLSKEEI